MPRGVHERKPRIVPAQKPFTMHVAVPDQGVSMKVCDARGRMIGTITLEQNGLSFVRAHAKKPCGTLIRWKNLQAMQNYVCLAFD